MQTTENNHVSKITGQSYNVTDHSQTWHNNSRLKQATRLSKMFGFELCQPDTEQRLIAAVKKLEHMYHTELMTPAEFVKRFDWHSKYFGTFLESLGIKRRTRRDAVANYVRSIGRTVTDEKQIYHKNCRFKFDVYRYPKIIGWELLKDNGWYHPINNLDGLTRDHMISISYGYENNIAPSVIAHPANCHIMPVLDNIKKNFGISITYEQLLARIENWDSDELVNPTLKVIKRKRPPIKESTRLKLRSANVGKKCYTDGINNIWIRSGDAVPDGYKLGMTMPARSNAKIYQINWDQIQSDINSGFRPKDIFIRNGINCDQYHGGLRRNLIKKIK